MAEKPELIIFNQYKIGGVQSFYYNILKYAPNHSFDVNWLFLDNPDDDDPKPKQKYNLTNEVIVKFDNLESKYSIAKKLDRLINNHKGIILTNFDEELVFLHLYRRRNKTIFFVCHDIWYVHRAIRYEFLIDVFIAHNKSFFEELIEKLPSRKDDIFYMPYGVVIPSFKRKHDSSATTLNVVIAARLQESKGIHDIPQIDDLLLKDNIVVKWTIIGDGPEKKKLVQATANRSNFTYLTLPDNDAVLNELQKNDIFILPSRIEGLPVSMLEAMSVGCVPVVANFNSGIKEIITNDIGYVIEIGNCLGFYQAIKQLHADKESLISKSKQARLKIKNYYDINKRSAEYFDLFQSKLNYKKPYVFIFPNYGGYLENPWVPVLIQKIGKFVKRCLGELR